jgi:hypothetical protein
MVVPVPHEIEADYVRELFRRRASGESLRQLAAWVTLLPDAARGGRQLSVSSVRDALDCPLYVARNGPRGDDVLERPSGRWEPLCDDDAWARIHPHADDRENSAPIALRGDYPLTHFLFCEVCGARLCGQLQRGSTRKRPGRADYRNADRRVYVCTSRMSGADARAQRGGGVACYRTIDANLIERQIFGTFDDLLAAFASPMMRDMALKEAREYDERSTSTGNARRLLNVESERKAKAKSRSGLTIALSDGLIDTDAYAEAVAELNAEIATIDAEIERLTLAGARDRRRERERPIVEVILDHAGFWQTALSTGTTADRREFLRLVLDSATPRRLAPGKYLAGMRLTPLGVTLLQIGATLMPGMGYPVESVRLAWANCTFSTGTDDVAG